MPEDLPGDHVASPATWDLPDDPVASSSSEDSPVRPSTLDRRRFLALGGGMTVAGAAGVLFGPAAWHALFGGSAAPVGGAPVRAAHPTQTGRTLVLVTLYGGNDGLNTVIPTADSAYGASRGTLAIDPARTHALGEGFGLHPAMGSFAKLWAQHRLAIVLGIGFAAPNYSHFESMDIWQSGVPGTPVSSGWLGRWMDATNASPLEALAVGPTLPTALTGEKVQGVSVAPGPLRLPGGSAAQDLYRVMAAANPPRAPMAAAVASSGADLLDVATSIGPVLNGPAGGQPASPTSTAAGSAAPKTAAGSAAPPSAAGSATPPPAALAISDGGGGRSSQGVLAAQLDIVAQLILAGAAPHVYSVELGGFDTHADQAPTQEALLGELDSAIGSFVDLMSRHPRGSGVVTVIYTEFGRRVAANASGGTDHGWANVAFVVGPSVKGGFYGEPPSLTKLSDGNTVFTTDFRSLYATVLAEVIGVDPKASLGATFRPLPLL